MFFMRFIYQIIIVYLVLLYLSANIVVDTPREDSLSIKITGNSIFILHYNPLEPIKIIKFFLIHNQKLGI